MGAPLVDTRQKQLLQPAHVLKAAEQLGIDPADARHTHLLGVAKALLETPLRSSWERSLDEQGNWVYVSKRTGQAKTEHPQLDRYQHLVNNLAAHPPKDYERKTCMQFVNLDGSTYIHDFRADAEAHADAHASQQVAEQQVSVSDDTRQEAPGEQATLGESTADQAGTPAPEQQQEEPTAAAPAQSEQEEPTAAAAAESEHAGEAAAAAAAPPDQPGIPTEPETAAVAEPQPPPPEPPQPAAAAAPSEPAPAADEAPGASDQAGASSSPGEERMIPAVPSVLLESFGLLNSAEEPEPLGETGVRPGVHRLCYYSWWYEDIESTDLTFRVDSNCVVGGGLRRRYVTLEYHLGRASFSIVSSNEDQELRIPNVPVVTKAGAPAEIWDLHVGATLTALGRSLALHKADLETSNWNDRHAERLKLIKAELLAELQKYKPRGHKNEVAFERGDRVHNGGLSLRHTVEQIKKLAADLQQYRPAMAEKYRARINIKL